MAAIHQFQLRHAALQAEVRGFLAVLALGEIGVEEARDETARLVIEIDQLRDFAGRTLPWADVAESEGLCDQLTQELLTGWNAFTEQQQPAV